MVVESLPQANDILYYMILQFVGYFGPGYLLLKGQFTAIPFVIRLPLYLSVGMLTVTVLVSIIGVFYIWEHSLLIIGAISYAFIFVRLLLSNSKITIGTMISGLHSHIRLSSIFSFAVFSFTVAIFVYISGYLQWSQPGDSLVHGFLTNLLVTNHKLQTTLAPVAPSLLWSAPFGFHVMAANLTLLFNIFAGASVFVTATTVMTVFLLLAYTAGYILTRSVIFSSFALMSGFYVSSIPNLEYWLIGYYYNGPYPFLFGCLGVLTYLVVQFADQYVKGNKKKYAYWSVSLISLAAVIIIYPPLAILPAIHFALTKIIKNRRRLTAVVYLSSMVRSKMFKFKLQKSTLMSSPSNMHEGILGRSNRIGLLALGSLVFAVLLIISITIWYPYANNFFSEISYSISQMLLRVDQVSHQYSLTPTEFFMSDLDALITFLTIVAAAISIAKGKYIYLGYSYLLFAIVFLLSVWSVTSNYFWFILPRRLFVFLIVFNWIVILTYARIFTDYLVKRIQVSSAWFPPREQSIKHIVLTYGIYALIAAPAAALLLPDLISNLRLIESDRWVGWFSRSDAFINDYAMIAWISENIDPNDLIMVQNSHTSSFIYSITIRNITSLPLGLPESEHKIQLAFDNQLAWDRPQLLKQFTDEYGIKYVFLSPAPGTWGYKNPVILGGDRILHNQKYSVRQYDNILSNMSFLEPIKTIGSSKLYRVVPND